MFCIRSKANTKMCRTNTVTFVMFELAVLLAIVNYSVARIKFNNTVFEDDVEVQKLNKQVQDIRDDYLQKARLPYNLAHAHSLAWQAQIQQKLTEVQAIKGKIYARKMYLHTRLTKNTTI